MRYTDSRDMPNDLPTTRVLLIDDESRSADLLSDMLSSEPDIMVQHQPSPMLAEQTALSFQPSIILVDLRMPGIDGRETAQRLIQANPAVKVMILTAFGDERVRETLACGATAYLHKDAAPGELNKPSNDKEARQAEGESIDEDEVQKLEGMMRKLQGVRDMSAGLPEDQRKRMAAKAVSEVMKEL